MSRFSAVRQMSTDDALYLQEAARPSQFDPQASLQRPALVSRAAETSTPSSQGGAVGIGAVSIFALVIILCLSVLSVLAAATAHSSHVLAERQAHATWQLYQNELAAQTFVAGVDAYAAGGADAVEGALSELCSAASQAAGGEVEVFASMDGPHVRATFTCSGGRTLAVAITVQDGTYSIDSWRTTAIVNEEQPMGTLYQGD